MMRLFGKILVGCAICTILCGVWVYRFSFISFQTSVRFTSGIFKQSLTESNNQRKSDFSGRPIWETSDLSIRRDCLPELALSNWSQPDFQHDFEFLKTDEGKKYKKILAWNNAYGPKFYSFGPGHKPFEWACCKEPRCFLTNERGLDPNPKIPFSEFDAIIFHFRGIRPSALPKRRSAHQRWIFYEVESAAYSFEDPGAFDGVFNWTMSYRLDSDIYQGYGYIFPNNIIFANSSVSRVPARTMPRKEGHQNAMVAWLVSHCETISKREKYVSLLKKYMPVDIYGTCGSLVCPGEGQTNVQCYEHLERKYKFYLSFENSLCKGYITEKFFFILRYNMVPVVYGHGDYTAVAPPHSYIDVRDFKSVKALADYLLYLGRNDSAYNEYFRWKENFSNLQNRKNHFCRLCERLHNDKAEKVYNNLKKWFLEDAQCQISLI